MIAGNFQRRPNSKQNCKVCDGPALGIYFGQLIRIARICSNFGDFCKRTVGLSKRLQQQGYRRIELVRLTSRFFNNKSDLISKYNQNCLTTFVRRVVYKV